MNKQPSKQGDRRTNKPSRRTK